MDVTGTATHLDEIGLETWTDLVRRLLDEDRTEVIERQQEPIFIGVGTGTQLYRVSGSARVGERAPRAWSLVMKVFTTEHFDFQSVSEDPSAWDYWKREWLAYQAPWFAELSGPLVSPRCLGAGEIRGGAEPVAWIALEDLGDVPHQWPLADFGEVAHALGVFGGRYLTDTAPPDDPWLSDHWLVGWTDQAGETIGVLPAAAQHPDAGRIYPSEVGAAYTGLWENRQTVYAALDELPTTFTHNDVFPRNLRRVPAEAATRNVAFDWAYCGTAPLGAELAPLVGATMAFLGSPPGEWDELERLCLAEYVRGLREQGWEGSAEEVRFGYAASLVLRYGLGPLAPIVGLSMVAENRHLVPLAFGCSFEEFLANGAAMTRFQCERIREVNATLGI